MAAKEDNAETPAAKTSGGMLMMILLAIVCGAGSFAAMFFLTPAQAADAAVCVPGESAAQQIEPLAKDDQSYVELEEVLITIGNEPATRYVKMKAVVVTDKAHANDVKKAEPMLKDAFISYLRSLELSDFESASFYPRLRQQLAHRSELVLGGEASRGVLITEFLLR